MAEYSSGQISIGGLGNGTDFSDMIAALKKIELRHANQLARWQSDWQTRLDAFGTLRQQLTEFSSFMKTMNTKDKFMAKSASVSSPTVASVASTVGAADGSYNLNVKQLATNSYASIKADVESKLKPMTDTATTFSYTYNGAVHTIDVGAGTSLEGLKNLINNEKDNKDVRATIVEAGGDFYLQLYSLNQGEGTEITVTDDGGMNYDGAWQYQAGQNAKMKWNGFPEGADTWYSFNTNNINIYGLNINLLSPGETLITVSTDTAKIKENVIAFMDAVNAVRSIILSLSSVNGDKTTLSPDYAESQFEMQKGSVLTGNYGVQLLSSLFKTTTMDQGAGFEYLTIFDDGTFSGELFSSLAQIGIKTDSVQGSATFGLLIFEEDENLITFDKALALSPDGVAELFAANKQGYSDSGDFLVYDTMSGFTKAGKYDVKYKIDDSGNIYDATINGKPARVDEDGLLGLFDTQDPAGGMRLLIVNKTEGDYSGVARVKDGKFNSLIELVDNNFLKPYVEPKMADNGTMIHNENGMLSILEHEYKTIIENIKTKIAKEDERLVKWERNMKLRFARLDETLKKYENLNAQLEAQIKQLSDNKSS